MKNEIKNYIGNSIIFHFFIFLQQKNEKTPSRFTQGINVFFIFFSFFFAAKKNEQKHFKFRNPQGSGLKKKTPKKRFFGVCNFELKMRYKVVNFKFHKEVTSKKTPKKLFWGCEILN